MLLEDKNAVIYEGGGAIGGAVARAFAREGARVFLADRTLESLEELTITAGPARRAFPNVGGFDTACAAIEGLWRSFAAELGSHGVRLVVVGSAGSPDAPAVREVFEFHAEAAGMSLEYYLADSGGGTLLGWLPTPESAS